MPVLIPVDLAQHEPDQPLPHDLFNQQGILVAGQGSVITDPVRRARLMEMRLFRQEIGRAHV
jgi:hypothetical protein